MSIKAAKVLTVVGGVLYLAMAWGLAVLAAASLPGCAHTIPPGPESEQTIDSARKTNNPPSSVGIMEQGINWQASGTASTKAVRVTPDEVTQLGTGPATRQVVYQTAGSKFVLASETDFGIEMVDYNPADGRLVVKGFKTSATEPTKALAETMKLWVEEVKALAPEQRKVVEAKLREQAETIKAVAPTAAKALVDLAGIFAGGV